MTVQEKLDTGQGASAASDPFVILCPALDSRSDEGGTQIRFQVALEQGESADSDSWIVEAESSSAHPHEVFSWTFVEPESTNAPVAELGDYQASVSQHYEQVVFAWVPLPAAAEEETADEVAEVIGHIQSARPLEVSDELRSLAKEAARRRHASSTREEDIEEWARRIADSVVDADD